MRRLYKLIVIILCLILSLVFMYKYRNPTSITSNSVTNSQLAELLRKANSGDPAAQLDLSVVLDNKEEGQKWLEKAAASKYQPAVYALARSYIIKGGTLAIQARNLLEMQARNGHYPSLLELADCLNYGKCGPKNKIEALSWVITSKYLADNGFIKKNLLADLERKIVNELNDSEKKISESKSLLIINSIKYKDSNNQTVRP